MMISKMPDSDDDFSDEKIPVNDLYEKALNIYMSSRDLLIELSQLLEPKN